MSYLKTGHPLKTLPLLFFLVFEAVGFELGLVWLHTHEEAYLLSLLNLLHSLCFKSNTVNEGLVAHFQKFVVVAYRCLAFAHFPPKNRLVLLLAYSFDIVVAYFFVTYEQVKLYLLW